MSCCGTCCVGSKAPPSFECFYHKPLTKAALLVITLLFGGAAAAFHFNGFPTSYSIAFSSMGGASLLGFVVLCLATVRHTRMQFTDALSQQNKKAIQRLANIMQSWTSDYCPSDNIQSLSAFLGDKLLSFFVLQIAPGKSNDVKRAIFKASQKITQEETTPTLFGINVVRYFESDHSLRGAQQWLSQYIEENNSQYLFFTPAEINGTWSVDIKKLFNKETAHRLDEDDKILSELLASEIIRIVQAHNNQQKSYLFTFLFYGDATFAALIWGNMKVKLPNVYKFSEVGNDMENSVFGVTVQSAFAQSTKR